MAARHHAAQGNAVRRAASRQQTPAPPSAFVPRWLSALQLVSHPSHTSTPCRLRQKGLRDAWVRLEPAARQLAEGEGALPATLEDWVWANSLFW